MLNIIPKLIEDGQNAEMMELLSYKEVKSVVFTLDRDSVSGPDGFTVSSFNTFGMCSRGSYKTGPSILIVGRR